MILWHIFLGILLHTCFVRCDLADEHVRGQGAERGDSILNKAFRAPKPPEGSKNFSTELKVAHGRPRRAGALRQGLKDTQRVSETLFLAANSSFTQETDVSAMVWQPRRLQSITYPTGMIPVLPAPVAKPRTVLAPVWACDVLSVHNHE